MKSKPSSEVVKPKHPHKSTTHREKFIHFRNVETINPRFKSVTVFGRLEPAGWYVTLAMCVQGDQFDRAVGRQQARKKFFNQPKKRLFVGDASASKEQLYDSITSMVHAELRFMNIIYVA